MYACRCSEFSARRDLERVPGGIQVEQLCGAGGVSLRQVGWLWNPVLGRPSRARQARNVVRYMRYRPDMCPADVGPIETRAVKGCAHDIQRVELQLQSLATGK
jgi:hypothetical protein